MRSLNQIVAMLLVFVLFLSCGISALAYSQVSKGSKGNDVKTLQTMLNTVMDAGLDVDGDCGTKTVAAIKNFQKKYSLTVDGVCGPATWKKLEEVYNTTCTNHTKGAFSHADTAHPHKQYYKCSKCRETFTDGSTTKVKSCKTCYPPEETTSSYSVVKNGSKGNDVKILQKMLNTVMDAGLDVDGDCGAKTVAAIKNFQKSCELTVDGVCGPATWKKIAEFYNSGKKVEPPKSKIEIGKGKYAPEILNEGDTYSINGEITSTYRIKTLVVGIYNEDGSKTSFVKTVSPNATSYNISKIDSYIKFGRLKGSSKGVNYYFKVIATDLNGTTKQLINQPFIVKSYQVVFSSYQDVASFQTEAISTWVKPVRAKYLKIPGTGRAFGAKRDNGNRKHAGIDYYVSNGAGTPVYAMQSGVVVEYVSNFYYNTSAIAIQHEDGSIARYCEISTSLRVGESVKQNEEIARIKSNSLNGGTMLHLELYLGNVSGSLFSSANKYSYVSGKFNRRSDLINPEFLLGIEN